jgi:hypothetical protein
MITIGRQVLVLLGGGRKSSGEPPLKSAPGGENE